MADKSGHSLETRHYTASGRNEATICAKKEWSLITFTLKKVNIHIWHKNTQEGRKLTFINAMQQDLYNWGRMTSEEFTDLEGMLLKLVSKDIQSKKKTVMMFLD